MVLQHETWTKPNCNLNNLALFDITVLLVFVVV